MNDLREWLESRLDKIGDQIGRVSETQAEMNITQAQQAKDIEHHIKRTDLLDDFVRKMAKQMMELMDHIQQVRGVAKFIGIVSIALGMVATALKIFKVI